MALTRRELLQLTAGLAATALPGCGAESASSDASPQRVLIIGAGFAGLTLANALTAAGVDNVILEARNRVGGRTWTFDLDGTPVDLGGAWIHGPVGNPVACLAQRLGVTWTSAEVVDASTSAFDPGIGFISNTDLLNFVVATQNGFQNDAAELRAALGANASAAQAIDLYLSRSGLSGDQLRYADFALRQGIVELFYGGPAQQLSLDDLFEDSEFAGGNQFPVGGYKALVDPLAEGLDIRLGEHVQRVAYDRSGVTVETSLATYRGSHAVVTVPLGVLKANGIQFSPRLPSWKRDAITKLDMGNFEKVVLRFDRSFWLDARRRNFVYLSNTYGELPIYFDLTRFLRLPTLLCFCGGTFARQLSTWSDAAVIARVRAILGEIFAMAVPEPTHFARTNWYADPLAFGSYSYLPVGASAFDMDTLGAPVGERLLFAGEATVRDYYGSVPAAMLSGLREAQRLLGKAEIDLLLGPAPQLGCVVG